MTYTVVVISLLSAFASGAVLGARYLAFVLVPSSMIVAGAIAEMNFAFGGSFLRSLIWIGAALVALQFGYIFGTAALRSLLSQSPQLDPAARRREHGRGNIRL